MKWLFLLPALLLLPSAGCERGPDPEIVAQEMERWRGRWQCLSRIEEGNPIPAEEVAKITLTVGGSVYHFRWGDDFDEMGRYAFLPGKDSGVLQATIESPPEMAGRVIPLLYRLDGDDLTLVHREDLTLAKDFTSDPESGQTLERWKRIRPPATAP